MLEYVMDQGIIECVAYETLILRKLPNAKIAIFADVHVKHAHPLWSLDIKHAVRDTVVRELADAVIITGKATGEPPSKEDVLNVKNAVRGIPLIVGNGVNVKDVGYRWELR